MSLADRGIWNAGSRGSEAYDTSESFLSKVTFKSHYVFLQYFDTVGWVF